MKYTRVSALGVRRGLLPARCDVVKLAEGPTAILKDFSAFPDPIRRALGRIGAGRERRAYERLAGLSGIPRLIAALDHHALLIEHIAGTALSERPRLTDAASFAAAFERLLGQMHARGVAHGEIRLAHLLADAGGRPWLVDFATATVTDAARPSALFRVQRRLDRYGWLLIKERLVPGALTPAERDEQRRNRLLASVLRHNVI